MKEKFIIQKGISIPPIRPEGFAATLLAMEIGDSFWTNKSPGEVHGHFKQAKKQGLKITVRAEFRDDVRGCRVWRVE